MLQDDNLTLVPLWGLCDLYDRWAKPDKSQPCWHRSIELLEKQVGKNGPELVPALTNEAQALRRLGRTQEAIPLERRSESIQKTVANKN